MGHVLGLSHPDKQPARNLRLDPEKLRSPTACLTPLHNVTLDPAEAENGTIMFSLTRHRVRTCLAEDDFLALHALYPTCEHADAATQVR